VGGDDVGADLLGHVNPVDVNGGRIRVDTHGDHRAWGCLSDRFRVGHVDPVGQHPPCHGAVHGAGVEVFEVTCPGHTLGCAGLSRSCRTVDGDDDPLAV